MTAKEHLSRHDREIAEIRSILKQQAEQHAHEAAEMWVLMGKLARGKEGAQKETKELRSMIRALIHLTP